MGRLAKHSIVTVLVAALVMVPVAGMAGSSEFIDEDDDIGAGAMIADLLVVRPLSLLGLIVGSAAFVVSLPFAGKGVHKVGNKLVKEPLLYTFDRELGNFDRH